jgi:uncharacterized protein
MNYNSQYQTVDAQKSLSAQFVRVYGWMFLGLIITGFTSVITLTTPLMYATSNIISYLFLAVAEIGLVLYLSSRALRMSYSAAAGAFIVYSVLNGITLSVIFYQYTSTSITSAFFVTAAFFGFMSAYGLITKTDLSNYRSIFMMGIFAIIIASIINIFLNNSALYWIISFVGVAIFLGLTAYDNQKIKRIHASFAGTEKENNVAIIGALTLYLDFVNLFLFILRILGRRK